MVRRPAGVGFSKQADPQLQDEVKDQTLERLPLSQRTSQPASSGFPPWFAPKFPGRVALGTAALKGPGCLYCLAGTALSSSGTGKEGREFLLL